jgi:hypothetical protein
MLLEHVAVDYLHSDKLPHLKGLVRPALPPSLVRRVVVGIGFVVPALAIAQTPRDSTVRAVPATIPIPGTNLPFQFDLQTEWTTQRYQNLRCTSLEKYQASISAACAARFTPPTLQLRGALKSTGTIGDRVHVNIDYDMQREFDASQTVSLFYQGDPDSRLQRVDVGNITFATPSSRYITSALPSGNYGVQITNRFGPMLLRTIFAKQTGNVVQSRQFDIGAHAQQFTERETEDVQIERLRFFFTVDPTRFGRDYPNVDILNRAQLARIASALPDTLRPTRVLLYRLQFGTQPQNPNGPRFRVRGDPGQGRQTYDLLREGVDYYMDPSLLWFALVRPLNETNERLVVAYNVRINGRDTVWATTGGTPDLQATTAHDQVANLVMDPSVGPSSPAFHNEIRSAYRVAGEDLVRNTTEVRVVTGSGLLEHPLAGPYATFLQMFGLAQPTNPAEFDYENRLWPRTGDGIFNLGAGAPDVSGGQSTDVAQVIRDYFLVFPSLQPFAARDSGLVVAGNPANPAIYTIPGEYLYSPQQPASIYRLHLKYQTAASDEFGAITLGATQMRPGSERVLLDGRPLVRELDYHIDYDLGRLEFIRADTLFRLPRHVDVRYEENPVFAGTPTTLAGVVSELPLPHGRLSFTAVNQSQTTAFTRPTLGFQGASMFTAGITGAFTWDAPALTNLVSRLPFGASKTPSRVSVQAELASSRPQFAARNNNQAYVESFESDGGTVIPVGDEAWSYSSLPAYGHTLRGQFGATLFEPANAATLAWQTNVRTPGGRHVTFTQSGIDPLLRFAGSGIETNEPVLWLTLLPLADAGAYDAATRQYRWTVANAPVGRRFRSIRTVLSPAGVDLTRNEHLEFWTLLDTTAAGRATNPSLIFDFGDVSENALVFAPDTLTIRHNADGTTDSLFTGRHLAGFDSLDTERDPFSRSFNSDVNDTGLPGDVVDTLVVIDGATVSRVVRARICRATPGSVDVLGDPHTDCTVRNYRLDEEDIDQDNALNFTNARREDERVLRYVVDLADPAKYKRIGGEYTDTVFVNGAPRPRTRHWVLLSVPFETPTDSLNDVNRRRIRALRLTVVSGQLANPDEPVQLPIAELRVTGAPWLSRSNQTLTGIGGSRPGGGFVVLSSIGTTDSTAALVYQPPPGVENQADTKLAEFSGGRTAINERSMRVQAGNMPLYHRAEAYLRFPSGPQFFLGYQSMRVWGRGRGNGWGQNGELQMYVKVGRDENNFYLRRVPLDAGETQAAWTDVDVAFFRFVALRDQIQRAYLAGKKESIECTGIDSAIIAATPLPTGVVAHRFAACADGYMAYTIDPAVTAPNLAAVQELAVGMVRVANTGGASPILPSDSLELWVDDIRLNQQVSTSGMAGQVALAFNAGDFADVRMTLSNRDPNFRQLAEQPTFQGQRDVDLAATVQLQKLLPSSLNVALPLTVTKTAQGSNPLYLSQSDVRGRGTPGLRTPKNDVTTYSLTVRRATPVSGGIVDAVLDHLAATSTYVTGVDRTEFQDGHANNLSASLDYLITPDSARTARLPAWIDGALGALPQVLQAGPVGALRAATFRWNPTQFRVTSGIVRGDDRRVSFLTPSSLAADEPAASAASTRVWRNATTLELHPTNGFTARWEAQSLRDFRDYRDSTAVSGASDVGQPLTVAPGFERERTITTSLSLAPSFSSWLRPRADVGTQYSMLRDPNAASFAPLPGVIGVDSVLASRDTAAFARALAHARAVPRRMTAAQTASAGTTIDVAGALAAYTRDSTRWRRLGALFAPIDVSYMRSLLTTLDAASDAAPLSLQLGLAGPGGYRTVNGTNATTAGRTGTLNASGALVLPLGTSFVNRYRRTTTLNWIARPDSSLAHVDGWQTQFPDVSMRWALRPAAGGPIASADASIGFVRNTASVSLPNVFRDDPPRIRRTHADVFPVAASLAFGGSSGFSTNARYSMRRQLDSLPGSIARSRGDELSVELGRAFKVPESLGLDLKSAIRTRLGYQQSRNTTLVLDQAGAFSSRLADNGRRAVNLTADASMFDDATFTFQGSYVLSYDNNLNRRFAQTVFSVVMRFLISAR